MKHHFARHAWLLLPFAIAVFALPTLSVGPALGAAADSPENGRLAFARNPDTGGLFTVNPDGTGLVRIGDGEFPQFSPDGTRLSFACRSGDHVAVCLVDADGSNLQQVVPDTSGMSRPPIDFYPTGWSPEGDRLLIDAGAGLSMRAAGIYTMRPDGSDLTRLTSTASEQIPYGFSPDGSKILYLQINADFSNDLFVIDADGTDATQINPPSLTLNCCLPPEADWSPDSRSVVFPAFDATNKWGNGIALYTAHADGSGLRRLTAAGNTSQQPAWSPDGEWIAYQKAGGFGYPKIVLVRPDGSGRHDVTIPAEGYGGNVEWSPDSQRLVMTYGERPDYQFDIWTLKRDGTDFTQVTDTRAFDEAIDWGIAP